jgi:hypothetical protein
MDFFSKAVPPGKSAIAGVVTDASGKPLGWAAVLIIGDSPKHPDIAATTNAKGQYRFDGLQPGTYNLLVNVSGHASKKGHVTVQVGDLAHLDFQLN